MAEKRCRDEGKSGLAWMETEGKDVGTGVGDGGKSSSKGKTNGREGFAGLLETGCRQRMEGLVEIGKAMVGRWVERWRIGKRSVEEEGRWSSFPAAAMAAATAAARRLPTGDT